MPYEPPKYPGAIPTAEDLPDRTDDVDWMYAARYNELKKELRAALIELGTDPAGTSADVKTRLGLLAPKASPVFTGQATIPTINLTGGQIKFPAIAAPSADPNTIDDYEEGTWTPDLQFANAKVGITYSFQAGTYTKVGRQVTVTCYFLLTSKGTSVGSAHIHGLPFTIANSDGAIVSVSTRLDKITFANTFMGRGYKNLNKIYIEELTEAGTYSAINNTNFANNSSVIFTVTYFIT